jgi:hypothetical protein
MELQPLLLIPLYLSSLQARRPVLGQSSSQSGLYHLSHLLRQSHSLLLVYLLSPLASLHQPSSMQDCWSQFLGRPRLSPVRHISRLCCRRLNAQLTSTPLTNDTSTFCCFVSGVVLSMTSGCAVPLILLFLLVVSLMVWCFGSVGDDSGAEAYGYIVKIVNERLSHMYNQGIVIEAMGLASSWSIVLTCPGHLFLRRIAM